MLFRLKIGTKTEGEVGKNNITGGFTVVEVPFEASPTSALPTSLVVLQTSKTRVLFLIWIV